MFIPELIRYLPSWTDPFIFFFLTSWEEWCCCIGSQHAIRQMFFSNSCFPRVAVFKKRRLFITVRSKYPNIHRVESPSLEESKERVDVAVLWFGWQGGDWSQAGLNLEGLFQPQWFCKCNHLSSNHYSTCQFKTAVKQSWVLHRLHLGGSQRTESTNFD